MIYFIRAGIDGPVKIGWTEKVPSRMAALQTGQPFKINLLRLLDAPKWAERWLHETFDGIRLEGEWFSFSEDMLTIEPPKEMPKGWTARRVDKTFQMRTTDEFLRSIDNWRRGQAKVVSRSAAIRYLTELAMKMASEPSPTKRIAHELASSGDSNRRRRERNDHDHGRRLKVG